MRHQKIKGKLGCATAQRKALIRSLVRGLIINRKVKLTLARAKQTKRVIDKLIDLAQNDEVKAQRLAFRLLQDRKIVYTLFREIAPKKIHSRLTHLPPRRGDGAKMAVLEL
ncbi:MAG: 50S ribosomal protein L17 [Candidatus Omnitrophota bacterium]|nr:MAG: 50S ribosomal protein L17 [Candidatus Omnitrophota bacterium]